MKITCLAENTAFKEDYLCEHGLSLYIETEDKKILFDMGQTDIFAENAEKLGISLGDTDFAILSHGHYDHGGGLKRFMELSPQCPVYINRHAFGDYYNGTEKYIGLDKSLEGRKQIVFTDGRYEIAKGITLYTLDEGKLTHNMLSKGLNVLKNGEFAQDDFCHEQYLVIEEKGKKVLVSGCSHKGILDICDNFRSDVVVGGFHFSKLAFDETLEGYAKYLDRTERKFYTCHCTGTEQYEYMKRFCKKLDYLSTGKVITV